MIKSTSRVLSEWRHYRLYIDLLIMLLSAILFGYLNAALHWREKLGSVIVCSTFLFAILVLDLFAVGRFPVQMKDSNWHLGRKIRFSVDLVIAIAAGTLAFNLQHFSYNLWLSFPILVIILAIFWLDLHFARNLNPSPQK